MEVNYGAQPVKFEIYCAVNEDNIFDLSGIVKKYIDSATFTDAWGLYDDEVENGFHLTFVGYESDRERVVKLADELRIAAAQNAVLLTETKLESSVLIRAPKVSK